MFIYIKKKTDQLTSRILGMVCIRFFIRFRNVKAAREAKGDITRRFNHRLPIGVRRLSRGHSDGVDGAAVVELRLRVH